MHHHLADAKIGRRQKGFADPDEISLALIVERHARAHAGMDKGVIAQNQDKLQPKQKLQMLGRHGRKEALAHRRQVRKIRINAHAIAFQGVLAALADPALALCRLPQKAQEIVFVVAAQKMRGPAGVMRKGDQVFDHAAAVGPAINIVAEEDQMHREADILAADILGDQPHQFGQQIVAPVDVANGVKDGAAGRGLNPGLILTAVRGFSAKIQADEFSQEA